MLSERVQYQGEAGIFELSFQNCISQNTGKCKLAHFYSDSHIATSISLRIKAPL